MLVTATTLKDSAANVERFVTGNLVCGADHLVVFVDAPDAAGQAEVLELLDDHPAVTCVPAGGDWWGGRRPEGLNERQCTNANAVVHLLADIEDAWVFHIDGDEIVYVDRDLLSQVPAGTNAVQLATWETVAQLDPERSPTKFKRALDEGDLTLLTALGVIDQPNNRAYFHGHLQGKGGVRPGSGAWLTLHRPIDRSGRAVPSHADPRLGVLHYESWSGADFVRKWRTMVASGPPASFRPGRARVASALRTLISKDLPADVLDRYLLRIFELTTLDEVETLETLGLLVEIDPGAGEHRPTPLPTQANEALRVGLEGLRGKDKSEYFHGSSPKAQSSAQAERPAPARSADQSAQQTAGGSPVSRLRDRVTRRSR